MMAGNKRLNIRYEVTTYDGPGAKIETKSMSAQEQKAINVEAYHHLLASAWGEYGYRTAEGEWVQKPLQGCGMGEKVSLKVVRAMQDHPGVLLRAKDVADLTMNWTLLNPNPLSARLKVIRAAHGENGANPRFFLSQRDSGLAIKWPAEFTWIRIDRI